MKETVPHIPLHCLYIASAGESNSVLNSREGGEGGYIVWLHLFMDCHVYTDCVLCHSEIAMHPFIGTTALANVVCIEWCSL